MASPVPDWWQDVSPYLDEALEMDDDDRDSWLAGLDEKDSALAGHLRELLGQHRALSQENFLGASAAPFSRALPGSTAGAYRLVHKIGEGGMGSVWLAERTDGRFERRAAVKFPNDVSLGRRNAERFKREGAVLGRLTHPHISQLLDAGVTPEGQPYLVLEYVDGEQIDKYCDAHRLDVTERLRLFLDVLDAIAHAHANLIVHRDVKPSNVLIGAGGAVKLLDFGVAKLLNRKDDSAAGIAITRETGGAMTLLFAAPEQVKGDPVTTLTDLYAAGVLLYLLLCGEHPAGPGPYAPADLIRSIVEVDPRRPSEAVSKANAAAMRASTPDRLRRQLRGDLDTIV